ncbi:MAG TPA: AAA family ATPase [Sedimentisphaerales bacterium]|nr:AAA family ATPase [Sedimentisphaerales bacterium]
MIKKIYADNFRCLVNFQLDLQANQLWLGSNGTGKSSVVDLLCKVQRVLDGNNVGDVFSPDDLTLWQSKNTQSIGIAMIIDGDPYDYELAIECDRRQRLCRVQQEHLRWKGKSFFRFDGREAHLYRVNRDSGEAEEGTQFGADWARSLIPSIAERNDNGPLIQFRQSVNKWLLVHPIPALVEDLATGETRRLLPNAQNFAQWYRHAFQENPGIGYEAWEALKDVLPGFQSLSLKESGDSRKLTTTFRLGGRDCNISFGDLSDGQRQLIILYVILYSLKHSHSVLLIDEPDNFVSLREIQPWVQELQDLCQEKDDRQAIVISHHPEIINKMVNGTEILFSRSDAGHIVTKNYPVTDGLTAAETMARGWEDEQSLSDHTPL